jgi:hypothetical protein
VGLDFGRDVSLAETRTSDHISLASDSKRGCPTYLVFEERGVEIGGQRV